VHVPVNVPVPLVKKLTVPVGVDVPVLFVSVTVAVQDEALLTITDAGKQLTLVVVGFFGCTVSVKDWLPLLVLVA
jgi:hypothetical protein